MSAEPMPRICRGWKKMTDDAPKAIALSSHELARKLLELPNVPTWFHYDGLKCAPVQYVAWVLPNVGNGLGIDAIILSGMPSNDTLRSIAVRIENAVE
jgi:hypothetical protein